MRMQVLMGFAGTRFAQIFAVQHLNRLIMMRQTVLCVQIFVQQSLCTFNTDFIGNAPRLRLPRHHYPRLAAAGDTPAAASHYLDKMIRRLFAVGFGFANLIQNLFHIAGTMGNGNPAPLCL